MGLFWLNSKGQNPENNVSDDGEATAERSHLRCLQYLRTNDTALLVHRATPERGIQ